MAEPLVLIVDDEPGLLELFAAMVAPLGCRVQLAQGGQQALLQSLHTLRLGRRQPRRLRGGRCHQVLFPRAGGILHRRSAGTGGDHGRGCAGAMARAEVRPYQFTRRVSTMTRASTANSASENRLSALSARRSRARAAGPA